MPQEVCRHKIQLLHTDTLMAKDSWESEVTGHCGQCQQGGQESAFREKHLGEPPGKVLLWGLDNADEYVFWNDQESSDNLLHVKRGLWEQLTLCLLRWSPTWGGGDLATSPPSLPAIIITRVGYRDAQGHEELDKACLGWDPSPITAFKDLLVHSISP